MKKVINDLFDYKNRNIYQIDEYFKFSVDSILISEFVNVKNNDFPILDMCTGNGAIPLIISTKTSNDIIGFEIQKEIYDLAIDSIKLNKLEEQIKIINDDIKNIENYYPKDSFKIIVCNPPFFKVNEKGHVNNNEILAIARHEIKLNLEEIFEIVNKMLITYGEFYLVHRISRIDDIIYIARKNNINVKEIQLIATKDNLKPYIALFRCVKNSKPGVIVNKIININGLKTYQNIFRR